MRCSGSCRTGWGCDMDWQVLLDVLIDVLMIIKKAVK